MSKTDLPTGENDNVAERNAGYLRALDLHDETGQLLTAILVNLQRPGSGTTGPELRDAVRDTQHLVETFLLIRSIRDSGAGSRDPPRRIRNRPALRRPRADFPEDSIDVNLAYDPTPNGSGNTGGVLPRGAGGSHQRLPSFGCADGERPFSRSESRRLVIEDDGGSRGGTDRRRGPWSPGGGGLRGIGT